MERIRGAAVTGWAVAHAEADYLVEYTQSCEDAAAGYSSADRRPAEKVAAALWAPRRVAALELDHRPYDMWAVILSLKGIHVDAFRNPHPAL